MDAFDTGTEHLTDLGQQINLKSSIPILYAPIVGTINLSFDYPGAENIKSTN